MPPEPPDRSALVARLERGLSPLGIELENGPLEQLVRLAELLGRWALRMNLTAHRSPEEILDRLILDAAALLGTLPDFESAVDLGSGAGIPGLPFAILEPDRHFLLVEARERRHHFQRAALRELGVTNVRLLHGRFDEVAPEPGDLVIAQGVAPPERIASELLRWSKPGGWLAVPGGPDLVGAERFELSESRVIPYHTTPDGSVRQLWVARHRI